MFLDNKYTILYMKLVSTPDTECYVERHHIIPSSLGGTNDASNIISISARKHFLCHYLLIKMIKVETPNWYKMIKAFAMMGVISTTQNRYFNSRLYQTHRLNFSKAQSISQTGKLNSQFGTKWMHRQDTNIKVKFEEIKTFESMGFVLGRYKVPKIKQITKTEKRREFEKETLTPFLNRYLAGESLRNLATDYGKSHVSLQMRLNFHFPEKLNTIKHGSSKRKTG